MTSTFASRTSGCRAAAQTLIAVAVGSLLAAQGTPDIKTVAVPDPVKGWHDMSPRSPEELAAERQRHEHRIEDQSAMRTASAPHRDRLYFCPGEDGRTWAHGANYKASFGPDGVRFVPFFGSQAPQVHPVQFALRAVTVGGRELELTSAAPVRTDASIEFRRGEVVERYECTADWIEQSFVIDSGDPGDVEIVLEVTTDLVRDPALAELQFRNELGSVHYGDAFVVDGTDRRPVPTTFEDGTIRIHIAASLRRGKRLVVDPIIRSSQVTQTSVAQRNPDIAYDATFDRYLVVWEESYAANDTDIWAEYRDGAGTPIAPFHYPVAVSTADQLLPRVANLSAFDRFLVVYENFDPTAGLYRIWGRPIDASGANTVGPVQISQSSLHGSCHVPDVGGDPRNAGSSHSWLVVWQRDNSPTDTDIHGRIVDWTGTPVASTIFIDNSASTIHTYPSISQSNGNALTPMPSWLVAYEFRHSATDHDILASALDPYGFILTRSSPVDTSPADDYAPYVSTPATDLGGNAPLFMVGYQRTAPTLSAIAALVRPRFAGLIHEIPPTDLTQSLSLPGGYIKCESDGCRFALVCGVGNKLTTLGFTGGQLVMQEPLQTIPNAPAYIRLVSKFSAGGPRTDYGVVDEDRSFNPSRITMSTYRGHAPGNDVVRRPMACNGLSITFAGSALLGEQSRFDVGNVGNDAPGFLFGSPAPASTLLCTPCPIGVQIGSMLFVAGSTLPLTIPCDPALVGAQFAVQGLGLGSGPCIAGLRFSDTLDITVR